VAETEEGEIVADKKTRGGEGRYPVAGACIRCMVE
jgi:hypothetical protein